MNDCLLINREDTIHKGVDSSYSGHLNFPFVTITDSLPFKILSFNEISPPNNDSITERFLTQTLKKPVIITPQPIIQCHNEWQLGILIFCFFVISYIRITRKNFFKNLIQGFLSRALFRQMIRDGFLFSTGIIFPMSIVVLFTYTVFIYQLISFSNPDPMLSSVTPVRLFFLLFGGILVLLSAKTLLVKGAGILFKTGELTDEYLTNSYVFHIITTIILLPVLMFSVFDTSAILTYLSIFLAALLFIYRILRGILISMEMRKYSLYQNLLYLCTLEFLPVFIIVKTIS